MQYSEPPTCDSRVADCPFSSLTVWPWTSVKRECPLAVQWSEKSTLVMWAAEKLPGPQVKMNKICIIVWLSSETMCGMFILIKIPVKKNQKDLKESRLAEFLEAFWLLQCHCSGRMCIGIVFIMQTLEWLCSLGSWRTFGYPIKLWTATCCLFNFFFFKWRSWGYKSNTVFLSRNTLICFSYQPFLKKKKLLVWECIQNETEAWSQGNSERPFETWLFDNIE